MNKYCLLLLLLTIPSIMMAWPRHDKDDKLYKGFRAGYQSSQLLDGSNKVYEDPLRSFYVGIFGAKRLGAGKFLSLYTGLSFYQTGSIESSDTKINLSYISLPVNLRIKVGPAYVFGGLNAAYKVGEKNEFAGVDIKDLLDIGNFDTGAQLGIGMKFGFIGAEVKYNWGLVEITDGINTKHFEAGVCLYL